MPFMNRWRSISKKKLAIVVSVVLLLSVLFLAVPANRVEEEGKFSGEAFNATVTDETANPIKQISKVISNVFKPSSDKQLIMAWIYPGEPACKAKEEYSDGRSISVLKPEYFRVEYDGSLSLLTEENTGCNGFSEENLASVKQFSEEQYVTVASVGATGMTEFLRQDSPNSIYTNQLVEFVEFYGLTGVELDFEDYANWDESAYVEYKQFVLRLGNELHQKNKKLMIDGPPISSEVQANWYTWKYEDFNDLPVDYVVVMAYDYQFDQGTGSPVSPLFWLEDVTMWVKSKVSDDSRIVIGIPSYGYKGEVGTHWAEIMTYDQISSQPGFDSASREDKSGERIWQEGGYYYVFQDEVSIQKKAEVVSRNGIDNVSIWHLGGNRWLPQ